MTQPQDPWGNSSIPKQNPQLTQPFNSPQAGYNQAPPPVYPQPQQPPVYYQSPFYPQQQQSQSTQPFNTPVQNNPRQTQYPQIGYFGGAPEPKKQWPWWATTLLVFGVVLIIVIIGSAASKKDVTPTVQPTNVAVSSSTPTFAALASSNEVKSTPTERPDPTAKLTPTLRPTVTQRPATITPNVPGTQAVVGNITELAKQNAQNKQLTSEARNKPKEAGIRVGGSGQELIGQSGNEDGLIVTVTKVDRFSQIYNYDGSPIQSQGVFLVVSYDLYNSSSKPQGFAIIRLIDGQSRTFSSSDNFDVSFALGFNGYKEDLSIQPTFSGKGFTVFEVPPDAANFKIKVGF